MRKTSDEYRLWINYGQGWELETTEENSKEIRARYREYPDNCPEYPAKWTGPHRVQIKVPE